MPTRPKARKTKAKPKKPRAKPGPKAGDAAQAYANQLNRVAQRNEQIRLAGREIGPVPDIADVERRRACMKDLALFCKTYNPAAFRFSWSQTQIRGLRRMEDAILNGGLYAFSWRRGGGKTSVCRMAVVWGAAYGHLRYPVIIGATDPMARKNMDGIQKVMRFSRAFIEDFPEIAFPIGKLNGIPQKANGQLVDGRPTLMEWSDSVIVLPTVPVPANWPADWPRRSDGMAPTSGSMIASTGLTGAGIRGLLITTDTGEFIRPDFVLLDDPQTRESSQSPTQNIEREQLISADVLGLAGPGEKFAAVMPCTPITPGDMVDGFLDVEKYPQWRGERSGMLSDLPKNLHAWETQYFDAWKECVAATPQDFTRCNELYQSKRSMFDEGCVADWEENKKPTEVSAIQSAMHIYLERGRRAFMAEYQCRPETQKALTELRQIQEADLAAKLNRQKRGHVPPECNTLTAFIDVQGEILFWMVVAWTSKFGGSIVDYGTFPGQSYATFSMDRLSRRLIDVFPDQDQKTRTYSGLSRLTSDLFGKAWHQDGSPSGLTIRQMLIDIGYNADVVHEFISRSPFKSMIRASKGKGIPAGRKPLNEYTKDPADLTGWNWRIDAKTLSKGRFVNFDANAWKSHVAESILAPAGSPTSIYLPGQSLSEHPLLTIHLTSERRKATFEVEATGAGNRVEVWTRNQSKENHWWDGLVGCAVAASVANVKWDVPAAAGEKQQSLVPPMETDLNKIMKSLPTIVV